LLFPQFGGSPKRFYDNSLTDFMTHIIEEQLDKFRTEHGVTGVGALGTVLVVTRKAAQQFPVPIDALLTQGGGQVSGLSGNAINKILASHGIAQRVGTESGRTSRGTPNLAKAYARRLNEMGALGSVDLANIEAWWVQRIAEYFATEPFKLNDDPSKSLQSVVMNLLAQASERQKRSSGKAYVGAMLQHLVGAKLSLALPEIAIAHHGFSVADSVSSREGDFVVESTVLHCTTAPSEHLLRKCHENLRKGKQPLILTVSKSMGVAETLADSLDIQGRVEILDAVQFIVTNLYEMSLFRTGERKVTVERLIDKYNEVVIANETDSSLTISRNTA
jgi:Domain of unknown function (DUF4928)